MKTKIYLVSVMLFTLAISSRAQQSTQNNSTETTENNKRILVRLGGKTVPDDMSKEHPLAVKTANISGESERNDLLKLAEALNYQAQRLKREAETKTGAEKAQTLAEAEQFERKSLEKQINASEISGTINQVKFNSNKETINKLVGSTELDASKSNRTRALIMASEKNMQKARDLRQEAYSFSNLAAKLGTMSNAEEREVTALGEQRQAIELLYNNSGKRM